jgi:muramoyltetrapeptide carboxypeptidase
MTGRGPGAPSRSKRLAKLEKGALVRIVSPALPSMAFATVRIERARAVLADLGLRCDFSANCFEISEDGRSAGTARQRADDLHAAFADPEVGAVLCAAGGDSTAEILPYLDAEVFTDNPKPLVGRSDNIYLNAFLESRAGLMSYTGAAFLAQFGEPAALPETLRSFAAVLMTDDEVLYQVSETRTQGGRPWQELGQHDVTPIPRQRPVRDAWLCPGTATGRLVGGEVGILAKLPELGLLDTRGAILWWDTGRAEMPYAEENFRRLANVIDLRDLRGMIVGDNSWVDFSDWLALVSRLLDEHVGDVAYPVHVGGDCGHYDPVWILPYGDEVTLDSQRGFSYRPVPCP